MWPYYNILHGLQIKIYHFTTLWSWFSLVLLCHKHPTITLLHWSTSLIQWSMLYFFTWLSKPQIEGSKLNFRKCALTVGKLNGFSSRWTQKKPNSLYYLNLERTRTKSIFTILVIDTQRKRIKRNSSSKIDGRHLHIRMESSQVSQSWSYIFTGSSKIPIAHNTSHE